jgi:hypothetical protein
MKIDHRFAQRYHFKGVWDAAGKVVKEFIRNNELNRQQGREGRFATALDCYLKLRNELAMIKSLKPWEKWEAAADPRILDKTPFKVSKRIFGFVTEIKKEFEELRNKYKHILFSDRLNVPTMERLHGTLKIHSAKGGEPQDVATEKWHIQTAAMPCSCTSCRGMTKDECKWKHIRKEKEQWVSKKAKIKERPKNIEHQATLEKYEEELKLTLEIDKVTVKVLQTKLKLHNLSTSGLKHILAERLALFLRPPKAPKLPDPSIQLACQGIIDDEDLHVLEEDSGDEEEDDQLS